MQATAQAHSASRDAVATPSTSRSFPPLDDVTSPTVSTEQAAYYLNRRAQTLRGWACLENGPLRPHRLHGRLAWQVADIRRLVSGGVQ